MTDTVLLGETLWWDCPACHRKVHTTRRTSQTGTDFRCTYGCTMRHCVIWLDGRAETKDAAIYSYDKDMSDKSHLPFLAQLL
jgi:hypothetical protein